MTDHTNHSFRNGGPGNMWGWLLQRISAALLLFFVMAHLWIEHFLHVGAAITFHSVEARLVYAVYSFVDFGLLAVVVYHGLNGLRNVLLDLSPAPSTVRTLTAVLWVAGVVTFVWGVDILSPFLYGHPLFPL